MDVNEELKFLGNFTKNFGGGGREGGSGGGSGWWGGGGQGGCERRIEVFGKIHKNGGRGGSWGGVRLGGGQGGCKRRIEVFGKIHKNKSGEGVVGRGGVRWEVGLVGVRLDVNEKLKRFFL